MSTRIWYISSYLAVPAILFSAACGGSTNAETAAPQFEGKFNATGSQRPGKHRKRAAGHTRTQTQRGMT